MALMTYGAQIAAEAGSLWKPLSPPSGRHWQNIKKTLQPSVRVMSGNGF